MSQAAVLDPQSLGEIDALDRFQPGARAEVVELFFASLERDCARVSDAISREDAATLRAALHSIKGCALGIGAVRLAQRAANLEGLVRDGGVATVAPQIPSLRQVCDEAGHALRLWMSEASPSPD